jgi:hypothetical protein
MNKQKHVFLLFFVLSFFIISCNENVESYFTNYQELNSGGYLSSGWIPKVIPDNSYEIREIHNLDNNHVFGTFKYRSDSFDKIIDNLEKVDKVELEKLLQEINFPKRPEWFLDSQMLIGNELNFYRYDSFILIVNQKEKQIYFVY